jgi:hypothetical protein
VAPARMPGRCSTTPGLDHSSSTARTRPRHLRLLSMHATAVAPSMPALSPHRTECSALDVRRAAKDELGGVRARDRQRRSWAAAFLSWTGAQLGRAGRRGMPAGGTRAEGTSGQTAAVRVLRSQAVGRWARGGKRRQREVASGWVGRMF